MKGKWIFTFSLMLLISCSPKTYKALSLGEQKLDFAWEALGCYGNCAQYQAAIYDGQLKFKGIRNTKFTGDTVVSNIQELEFELIQKLTEMDFLSLDSLYTLGGSAYDGPGYRFQFSSLAVDASGDIKCQKKIESFGGEPETLNSLSKWLNKKLAAAGLL